MSERTRVLIVGAAGRDFHCFNRVYREDPSCEVVAFTAAQIPGIDHRSYPAELAGPLYPDGVPVRPEAELEAICRDEAVDRVVFAYSDVTHEAVMHLGSRALAAGADFVLLGPKQTMLDANVPVVAVSAVRTGCGKSQTARWITRRLTGRRQKAVAIRHPMPYGDLAVHRVQRFATRDDLSAGHCTTEEREEFEPYLECGAVVFAGVDYAAILAEAEKEADVIVWDGGNNDFPLIRPDLHIALLDALRPDDADRFHPGESVARMADVLIVNKVSAALPDGLEKAIASARHLNPEATLLRADSPVRLDTPDAVRGKRVLVVEDGPTMTHGGMRFGAGYVASLAAGAKEIVDPRASATTEIAAVYRAYPHLTKVLPAMGYNAGQLEALRRTIDDSSAEVVVSGSPVDLARLLRVRLPIVRARYEYQDVDEPGLSGVLDAFLEKYLGRDATPRD